VAPERIAAAAPKTIELKPAVGTPKVLGFPRVTKGRGVLRPNQMASKTPSSLVLPTAKGVASIKPKQVAIEAPKIPGFHPTSENLSVMDQQRSSRVRKSGDVLSPDKGQLVLFVPRIASDRVVVVRDEMNKVLDSVGAKAGMPLVRQYRLDPGTYELSIKGFADVTVTIKSGKVATIQLSQDRVSVTNKRSSDWEPIIDDLKARGSDIGLRDISSVTKVLKFTAELPGR
jgi:hypothetical protein